MTQHLLPAILVLIDVVGTANSKKGICNMMSYQQVSRTVMIGPAAMMTAFQHRSIFGRALAVIFTASSLAILPTLADAQSGSDACANARGDAAIAACTRVIEDQGAISFMRADAYFSRGNAHARNGDLDRAIADFTEVIKLDKDYTIYSPLGSMSLTVYQARAQAYGKKGSLDKAIADFTEATRLTPKDGNIFTNRGFAYYQKGALDKAIADFTTAIQLKDTNAYNSRGVAYAYKRDFDRAIADFTAAITINPKHISAFTSRAYMFSQKGEYDRAISDFTAAIQINPNDAAAYYNRGLLRVKYVKKDRKNAIADLKRAVELGHADADKELRKLGARR